MNSVSVDNDIVVRVDQVSKIFPKKIESTTLREEGVGLIKKFLPRFLRGGSEESTEVPAGFTALKDVSFCVQYGEALGIVGRNGSGKTTLIRLMANIMRPTTGTVEVRGRYAALIGLGTGFITEMTGRKNIYLNAAIYGVPPSETDGFINDVIDFAELGDFIDEPVKTYSSGMRARLGFSVAIHILPDVVFIDEALAVGDAGFQEKCWNRINQLRQENRTFIIVSHGGDIRKMCNRVIWIDKGQVQMDDDTETVLSAYQDFINQSKQSPK